MEPVALEARVRLAAPPHGAGQQCHLHRAGLAGANALVELLSGKAAGAGHDIGHPDNVVPSLPEGCA